MEDKTPESIQAEYVKVCAAIGEKQFRILMEEKSIQDLSGKLLELNEEYQKATASTAGAT